jgi:hypothetical protein
VVVIKESAEEVAGREAESALKEGGKYHIFIRRRCECVVCTLRNAEPVKDPTKERDSDASKQEPFEGPLSCRNRAALQEQFPKQACLQLSSSVVTPGFWLM